jgi:hypothetical protein
MDRVANINMENRDLGVSDIVLRVAWHTGGGDIDTGDFLRAFGSMSLYLYVLNHV